MRRNIGAKKILKLRSFAEERVRQRIQRGSTAKDIFYHLNDEEGRESSPPMLDQVTSDAVITIAAGSDTTSTVLAGLFYFLLKNPTVLSKLRSEVDAVFPPGEGDPFDTGKLANMVYLNACM